METSELRMNAQAAEIAGKYRSSKGRAGFAVGLLVAEANRVPAA